MDGVAGEAVHVDRRYLQHPLSVTVEVGAEPALLVQRADFLSGCDIGALYRHVLRQVLADPEQLLGAISWAEGELAARVDPVTAFPSRTMVAEFAAAVARDPGATAVLTDGERLTYAELDARSDAVAAWLLEQVPGELVGVTIPPSARLVVTMLGVFKAGKVYVPIDAVAAPARVAQIAEACPGITLVTDDSLPDVGVLEELPPAAARPVPAPGDTAYAIFTSGTTGTPKGVRISHGAAVRFFDGLRTATGIGVACWLLFHSMSFDISLVETFGALFGGGTVCIPSGEVKRDPAALGAFLTRHRVAVVSQTPSAFALHGSRLRELASLRHVLLCGERLEFGTVAGFVVARPDVRVWNCYGITETTMYHTAFEVPGRSPEESVIGRPFADTGMAVVDAAHRVLPRGVPGQLVISGPGLMQGYLHHDGPGRIVEIGGVPTYLSGDRGTLTADGQFVVAGRIDSQVKIRGHRLEPGEVVRGLHRTGLVAHAHVLVAGEGLTAELVCFVVLTGRGDIAAVRERLRPLLPRAFHPDRYLAVDALPVNVNGKLDTAALTRLYTADPGPAPVAADSAIDSVVTEVWAEVLGSTAFDGGTRFFDAGGTSAMVLQLGERLRARLGLPELSVVDLFEHCTPDTLTEFLAERV